MTDDPRAWDPEAEDAWDHLTIGATRDEARRIVDLVRADREQERAERAAESDAAWDRRQRDHAAWIAGADGWTDPNRPAAEAEIRKRREALTGPGFAPWDWRPSDRTALRRGRSECWRRHGGEWLPAIDATPEQQRALLVTVLAKWLEIEDRPPRPHLPRGIRDGNGARRPRSLADAARWLASLIVPGLVPEHVQAAARSVARGKAKTASGERGDDPRWIARQARRSAAGHAVVSGRLIERDAWLRAQVRALVRSGDSGAAACRAAACRLGRRGEVARGAWPPLTVAGVRAVCGRDLWRWPCFARARAHRAHLSCRPAQPAVRREASLARPLDPAVRPVRSAPSPGAVGASGGEILRRRGAATAKPAAASTVRTDVHGSIEIQCSLSGRLAGRSTDGPDPPAAAVRPASREPPRAPPAAAGGRDRHSDKRSDQAANGGAGGVCQCDRYGSDWLALDGTECVDCGRRIVCPFPRR
ncbi:MAG: hypothetical protein OXG39_09995 [Chloroflexi bacterium]|nr:hypothetical protein [Chloroflexota bacterium]